MQKFLSKDDLKTSYTESKKQGQIWKDSYPEYERLMDNGLLDMLDENLPEVNDGSLSAALFKLPKRIVKKDLSGRAKATNRDEAWLTELANLQWENNIVKNANMQAPFTRKWKDAVRKAAGYGGIPIINLFVTRGNYTGSDFIVVQPQDVTLEAGKVSDYDSDVIYWDVYYTKLQLENMIEQAKEDMAESSKDTDENSSNKWYISELEYVLKSADQEQRTSQDSHISDEGNVKKEGFKFCVAFQRGVDAPFYMYHPASNKTVREWTNPDPTGDVPVHYLYCYQDFINPYGIGIVKLAGGTQNVLDFMRQSDVLATQIGIRPPVDIAGDTGETDLESIVYAQDAQWITGNAKVIRQEMSNGVYTQLPSRIQMYKTSLNQIIPTGDTSATAADTGDPTQSKTPAGVKLQAANLSIDDDDFKDNFYVTYAAVARSMINTQFANMEGSDLMKLSDDERELLMSAGMDFEPNELGEFSNELEVEWDTVRAEFDFEVDPDNDKTKDDADKLEGLTKVTDFISNPAIQQLVMSGQPIILGNKELNIGELVYEIVSLTTDNDKILTDITPEDQANQQAIAQGIDPTTGQPPQDPTQQPQQAPQDMPMEQSAPELLPVEEQIDLAQGGEQNEQLSPEEMMANIQAIMDEYGVDEEVATTALAAEHAGLPIEDIIGHIQQYAQGGNQ